MSAPMFTTPPVETGKTELWAKGRGQSPHNAGGKGPEAQSLLHLCGLLPLDH